MLNFHRFKSALLVLALTFCIVQPVFAEVETTVRKTYKAAASPLDVSASTDGIWLYVLNKGGKLQILSTDGRVNEIVNVDPNMDRIASAGLEPANIPERIFLSNSKTGTIQEIFIEHSVEINTSGDPFLGSATAKVEIVEFSDFECPYCSKVGALFEEILALYPDQVKIVFKQFPLSFHKKALPAAQAALAAHKQGKFWQYHDLLFENQKTLSEAKYLEFAKELQLDINRFNQDRKGLEVRKQVERDMRAARQIGVKGTPAIFINGWSLKNRSVPAMQKMIDKALTQNK